MILIRSEERVCLRNFSNNFKFKNFNFINLTTMKGSVCDSCHHQLYCYKCGFPLSRGYRIIITKLRKHNLLKDDYRNICCKCYQEEVNRNDNKKKCG